MHCLAWDLCFSGGLACFVLSLELATSQSGCYVYCSAFYSCATLICLGLPLNDQFERENSIAAVMGASAVLLIEQNYLS